MQQDSSSTPAFSATATPISKLSEDTIHEIFSFIAVIEFRTTPGWELKPTTLNHGTLYLRPLHNLHRASQVCKTWRRVILKASNLWGRVIDFDILSRCEEWKQEVIKRAGTSPLWVKGTVTNEQVTVFSIFLAQNWERVEVFEMGWLNWESYTFTPETCPFLAQPAKRLRHFRLHVRTASAEITNMFAGDAPHLRLLSTHSLSYRIQPSWTSGLRHMEVAGATNPSLTVQELFCVLKGAKRLEGLVLSGAMTRGGPVGEFDDIHLPHLRHITLCESIPVCNMILSHISTCRGTCMVVDAYDDEEGQVEDDCRAIQNLGLQYFAAYLEVHCSSHLHVQDFEGERCLSLASSPCEDAPDQFPFRFYYSTSLSRSLIESLVGLNFSSITSLQFEGDTSHVPPSSEYFLHFLRSFDHVVTLSTNTSTLESLLVPALRSNSTHLLFPSLRRLRVCRSYATLMSQMTLEVLRPVLSFLRQRSHSGKPIQTLDLQEKGVYGTNNALLAEIADLKVSWTKPSKISV